MTRDGRAVVHSWIDGRKLIKVYNSEGEVVETHASPHTCVTCEERDRLLRTHQVGKSHRNKRPLMIWGGGWQISRGNTKSDTPTGIPPIPKINDPPNMAIH